MARMILDEYTVTPHGGFRYLRTEGHGQCSRGYPCEHQGLDVYPPDRATFVVAPEDCEVLAVARDNASPPLSGYGPGAVLLRSVGWLVEVVPELRRWHVVGHIHPDDLVGVRVGQRLTEGKPIARLGAGVAGAHHEVRTAASVPAGAARLAFVESPARWVTTRNIWEGLAYGGVIAGISAIARRVST